MKFPPFVYSIAFWKAFSWFAAGSSALLVYFGALSENYLWSAAAILSGVLSFLNLLGVVPELRDKGLLK